MRTRLFKSFLVLSLLILGIGNAWGSHDYGSKLTVTGATGKGVVYADQVTSPSKVAYAYSSVSGPKTATDKSDDHNYYAWVKAFRGWSFVGWTASDTKSQTNSGSYYTVVVTPTKDGTKDASLTAKWKPQTAVEITYQVPEHGAYKVEYAYETFDEDSKSFVAANIASPNVTKNMNDASSAQTIDSYSGDIIKLTSTSGEFLGWYSSDDWAEGHKLSGANPYTYPVPASGPVSIYARYDDVETYYGKLNATVGTGSIPGGGKIYVSADAATGNITYSDATQNATKSTFGSGSQTYYLYAQPTDKRYTLKGWYTNAACTTPASVTKVGDHYEYTLTATSTNSGSPTEQTLYAYFEYNLYFLQVDVAPATPGLGMVLASKTSLSPAPQYDACSNESSVFTYALRSAGSANVYLYARGKYGYKFSGWYDNPECIGAAVGTANPFTYAAPASSADPQNPTLTTLYAKFVEESKINVTYNNPDHNKGEYKAYALGIEEVDDEYMWVPTEIFTSVGKSANTVQSQYKTDVLILEADPVSGFGVTSWSDGGTTKTTPSQRYETTATAVKTVGVTFGDAMPFMVSAKTTDKTGTQYATLRDALNNLGSNKKITVVQNAYVPAGDYEIPSGVTLLVPHTADYTVLTMPDTLQKNASFSQYCRLTLEKDANITVNGALCVAGQQYATTSGNPGAGAPCGKYGAIDMSKGGHITVNSGANLYAFGFVFGGGDKPATGTITIKSGGTVYEDIIINDMHGGGGTAACVNGTSASNDYGLFPFSQYFIQNIEPKMTIEHGGKENVCFAIYSGFGDKVDKIDMIGNTDACLFQTTSAGSSVTKWYDYSRDYQCYEVTGTMKMNKISISAADIITMSSDKFVLPINNNMEIRMRRNATMTLPYDVKLLPGAKLIIDEGASINVQKELYVYDKQDWDKYACGEYAQVVKNIPGHTVRTVSSLDNFDNATIVVNGTLRLSSSAAFYTTSHGGSVISEGTGKIVFDVAGKSAGKSLYEVWGTYGKSSTGGGIKAEQENPAVWPGQVQVGMYELVVFVRLKGPYYIFGTPVATTPAKLRNEDGSYLATAGAIKDDQFIYNKDMGKWLKNPRIVTWDAHGGEVEPSTSAHSQDAFLGELPMTTREGYTFNGWFTTASGGTKITPDTKVTANVTYHAQWIPNVYDITYMDQGKAAFSGTHIDSPNAHPTTHTFGTATTLNGATRTGYNFDDWHTISNCKAESKVTILGATAFTKDITLYAKWIPVSYTITYNNLEGASNSNPANYNIESANITLVDPGSRAGYDFVGWYTNEELTTPAGTPAIATGSTGAKTFWAKWTEKSYAVTFNNGGHGTVAVAGATVTNGATASVNHFTTKSLEATASTGYTFAGWTITGSVTLGSTSAASTTIKTTAAGGTVTATWTPISYTITYNNLEGASNSNPANYNIESANITLVDPGSRAGYDFVGWYTNEELTTPAGTPAIATGSTGAKTFWAKWTSAESGFYVDIVDVQNANASSGTLTINTNGWASSGWPYTVNEVVYEKGNREADRTLLVPYNGEVGETFSITVTNKNSVIVSKHNYIIPAEITANANLADQQILYVKSDATLTVNVDKTVKNIYVAPGAKMVVNNDITLTADTVFLRTTPWASAELELDGTISGQVCYTRIIKKKDQYYQFGLPMDCPIANVRLSDGSTPTYGNGWLLRSYSESKRATQGSGSNIDNWTTLTNEGADANKTIHGGVGYEMFSNSGYYREYYFPIAHTGLSDRVAVTRTKDATKGAAHEGWNIVVSPLMRAYTGTPKPEGATLSWLQEDGSYWQLPVTEIKPAIPFSYQATETGSIVFSSNISLPAPQRRVAAAEEYKQIQWMQLDLTGAEGQADETSIYAHPTRYDQTYQIGIDVAKQSLTATRALIYSSHAYGEMAFAGVSDELLEQGVALTVYSPKAQELTISMRNNEWLNRMAFVWLIDQATGAQIDLLESDYSFNAEAGTTAGRFILMGAFFAPQITTDNGTVQSDDEHIKAKKFIYNDKMYIQINGVIYDATGKLVK